MQFLLNEVINKVIEKIIQNTGGTHYGRKCEKEK